MHVEWEKKKAKDINPRDNSCRKRTRKEIFFKCKGKSGACNVTDTKLGKHFNEEGWSAVSNAAKLVK